MVLRKGKLQKPCIKCGNNSKRLCSPIIKAKGEGEGEIPNFLMHPPLHIRLYNEGLMSKERLESFLQGWFGYSKFANTYNLRKKIVELIPK